MNVKLLSGLIFLKMTVEPCYGSQQKLQQVTTLVAAQYQIIFMQQRL